MNKKVGIIGAGNIGCAIARGLVSYGKLDPSDICLSRKKSELLSEHKKAGFAVTDNHALVKVSDFLILAVLPGQAKEVILDLKEEIKAGNKILVSVVSAVSIQELQEWAGKEVTVVRIMPNTADHIC